MHVLSIPLAIFLALSTVSLSTAQKLTTSNNEEGTQSQSCHIVTLLPFTDLRDPYPGDLSDLSLSSSKPDELAQSLSYGYGQWPNQTSLSRASFSLLVAAEMGRRHFNERNGLVVPELDTSDGSSGLEELKGCDLRLEFGTGAGESGSSSSWVFDSGYSRSKSVDQFLSLIQSSNENPELPEICSVLGPISPRAHEGISILTESLSIPQLGFATIDRRLERVQDFPTFLRIIPKAEEFSARVATYVGGGVKDSAHGGDSDEDVEDNGGIFTREYIGVIYDQSDYGEQFEDPLEDAEDTLGYATMTEHVIEGDVDEEGSIYGSLGEAKEKGFRTILLITDRPAFLIDIANVAEELEMLGDNSFMWVISGAAAPPTMLLESMKFEVDSPIDKMLRGAALFTNYDPFVYNKEEDRFLQAWRNQESSLVEQVLEMQPLDVNGNKYYVPDDIEAYFETETPTEWASYIYDSVIATGIGACRGLQMSSENAYGEEKPHTHYTGIQSTKFHGASGEFKMSTNDDGEYDNTRDPMGTMFGAFNVRPGEVDENNLRSYETVLTSLWDESYGEEGEGAWKNVPGTEFLFYGDTTVEPMPLRTVEDEHYLSSGVQIAGLFLSSFAVVFSIGTGIFVGVQRKNKYIKSSQPEFCLLLCFGGALVASSLYFVSFDESDGFSEEKLSAMCTAAPWFFVVGYLTMFCALFSKLWRLSKVLSIRRRRVGIKQVMAPYAVILLSSVIVLSIWTAIDPLIWVRKPISGVDEEGEKNTDEPLETYGHCESVNYGVVPFIVPLGVLFAAIIGLTGAISWKLKEVSTDFADVKFIFFGIFTHIEIWLIGAPILVITNSVSKDAFYIMLALLAFIFSMSLVLLVVWPKIYLFVMSIYGGDRDSRSSAMSSVGIHRQTVVSGMNGDGDKKRIVQLESQVSKLKADLETKDSELRSLSVRLSSINNFSTRLSSGNSQTSIGDSMQCKNDTGVAGDEPGTQVGGNETEAAP